MEGKQGGKEPNRAEEGKITRRQLLTGTVVVGGLGILAYLYHDRLNFGCDFRSDLTTTAPTTTPPATSTTPGTTTQATTPPGTTTPATTTPSPTTTTHGAIELVEPYTPSQEIRPYLAIQFITLSQAYGDPVQILDVFLTNNGYGPSMAFTDVYKYLAPSNESEMFPISFPGTICELISREMVNLPPGAVISKRVYIDRSIMDGVWLILYDPLLDPATFTIDNAEFFNTDDAKRKYLYAGV